MQKKKEPQSKRRWIVVSTANNKPLLGWDDGVTSEAKAKRLNDSYMIPT